MTADGKGLGEDFTPLLEIRPRVAVIIEDGEIKRVLSDIPVRAYVIDVDQGGCKQPEVVADREELNETLKKEIFKS